MAISIPPNVGHKLQIIRLDSGLSVSEVSEFLSLDLAAIEDGAPMMASELISLCRFYGISLSALINPPEAMSPTQALKAMDEGTISEYMFMERVGAVDLVDARIIAEKIRLSMNT